MEGGDLIELRAGKLTLGLRPSVGGGVAWFRWMDQGRVLPILRDAPEGTMDVLELGSFPLVPFVNRIRGGRFRFRGREVVLKANMPGDPSPLHGQGWLAPWIVEDCDEAAATLSYRHEPGEWPWAYEARQHLTLDGSGLSIALTCRNSDAEPMPCGLGQHPYFSCGAGTRIDTQVDHVWTIDEHVLPLEQVPAMGRFDLRNGPACARGLDHGFGGWSGEAHFSDPDWPFTLRLSSPTARFFQLYSPPGGSIFVAEPVTHANAALNAPEAEWRELGMAVLEPGQELRLDMRLDVQERSAG